MEFRGGLGRENFKYGTGVSGNTTIISGGEYSDELGVVADEEAAGGGLVGTDEESELVVCTELRSHIGTWKRMRERERERERGRGKNGEGRGERKSRWWGVGEGGERGKRRSDNEERSK